VIVDVVETQQISSISVASFRDGKPRQVWRRGFATKREAEAELGRVVHRAGEGGDPFPKKITVRDYVQKWLASSDQRLRGSTSRRYRQLLDLYVIPVIGGLQLSAVKPGHVREVLDRVTAAGRSPRTAIQTRAVLRSALRQAVEDGLISVNPVTSVKPPKPERPRLEVLTGQDLSCLLTESKGTVWEIPMLLAACTGARRSEVLGLRWTDVDPANGRVRITRGLQRVADDAGNQVLRFLDLKTDRARRTVHLQPFAGERLKQLRAEQAERRLMLGSGWTDLDLVCEAGTGHHSILTLSRMGSNG
jgi:integrase